MLLVSIFAFTLFGCSDDEDAIVQSINYGTVQGKVVSNNNIPVARALVFYDFYGEINFTYSEIDGSFELAIPEGTGNLHIQTGNGQLFRTVTEITIAKDQVIDLTGTVNSKLTQQANLAYLAGAFDTIQDLVIDLGYTITEVTVSDLANPNLYDDYAAVFLNCDLGIFGTTVSDNMINYVAQGGSLYASDWAIGYYLGMDNASGTSCDIRPGGFIDDATICSEKGGLRPALYNSPVLSPELQAVLGKTEMDIDGGVWTTIHNIDTSFWEVLVEDTMSTPLVIKTNNITSSTVPSSPSANGNWVTICHIPPGNTSNPITITINANALDAHLAHGDVLGNCDTNTQSGNVYYTTFENHQSGPSAIIDVKKILEHIILSL